MIQLWPASRRHNPRARKGVTTRRQVTDASNVSYSSVLDKAKPCVVVIYAKISKCGAPRD